MYLNICNLYLDNVCAHLYLEYGGGLPPAGPRVHIEPARHGGQAVPGVLHYQPPALLTIGSWVSILTIVTMSPPGPCPWPPRPRPPPAGSPTCRRCRRCGQSGGWWPAHTGPSQPRQLLLHLHTHCTYLLLYNHLQHFIIHTTPPGPQRQHGAGCSLSRTSHQGGGPGWSAGGQW